MLQDIRKANLFYIDKTHFIKEWWENQDSVTLITRPRRFGKTLTMSMLEKFFSVKYADGGAVFEGLKIWGEEKYRKMQGTWPVISLSFANVKEPTYQMAKKRICQLLTDVYNKNYFLVESGLLTEEECGYFRKITTDMEETDATIALHKMSDFLFRYYRKKVIILLDEYDTPMQEAYVEGYWEQLVGFTRSLFNVTFKTNPFLERAIMTGITRVSKESVFSDLNNLVVITTTSEAYADCFGFTEGEVQQSLEEYGMEERSPEVRLWYDGFTFGKMKDIYNPWSILNFLKTKKMAAYWANTSSNRFVGALIRESGRKLKMDFEDLLRGKNLSANLDEQIVFEQLKTSETAVWSMLLASGYLKVVSCETDKRTGRENYQLALTNREVRLMFENIVREWFEEAGEDYNDFIRGLLSGDLSAMNYYMNHVAQTMFSYFGVGRRPSGSEPERFYHGFVLGLMVELEGKYRITSNRESGFGRYDVMLEPVDENTPAIIIEFKVRDPKDIIPLIEGKVQIGNIPIDPGVTNAKNEATGIIGFNTENSEIQEGLVRFDIVFYVKTKSGKAQIIINVEAQKSEPDKYDIINRGIFYVSRLISSQKGRDFVKSNYNDIKSVHSIWLCMNMDENCLNHIKLTDDKILGNHTWRGNLSLFNLVMIGITKKPSEYEEEYKLHRLLSSVLSDTMSVEEKLEIIENEYDIPVEGSFREDVDTMCNLSQEIEEKGIKKGIEEGIGKGKAEIILNMYEDGYSVEQIAKVARMDKESIEKICKKL